MKIMLEEPHLGASKSLPALTAGTYYEASSDYVLLYDCALFLYWQMMFSMYHVMLSALMRTVLN